MALSHVLCPRQGLSSGPKVPRCDRTGNASPTSRTGERNRATQSVQRRRVCPGSARGDSTRSPGLLPTDLPACLSPSAAFGNEKAGAVLPSPHPTASSGRLHGTPGAWELRAAAAAASTPSSAGAGQAGALRDAGRLGGLWNQVRSRAGGGAGIVQPLGPLAARRPGAGRGGVALPTLSSWVTNRRDKWWGRTRPLLPRPERAGPGGGPLS